jgi:hypothetical protein
MVAILCTRLVARPTRTKKHCTSADFLSKMVQKPNKSNKLQKKQSPKTVLRKSSKISRPVPRKDRDDVSKIRSAVNKKTTKSIVTLIEQKAAKTLTKALGISTLRIVKVGDHKLRFVMRAKCN